MAEEQTYRSYPDPDINPEMKDYKWGLQYARAMYSDFQNGPYYSLLSNKNRILANRKYRQGNQDTDQYKKLLECKDEDNDKSFLNLNWRVQSPLQHLMDTLVGFMYNRGFDMNCTAIDPLSVSTKLEKEWRAKATIALREAGILDELDALAGKEMATPEEKKMPRSMEEFEVWKSMDLKLAQEVAGENIIKAIDYVNEFSVHYEQVIDDFVTDGIGIFRDFVDAAGKIRKRRVDPVKGVYDYSHNKTFSDIRHFGERVNYTVAELQEIYGYESLSPGEWRELAKQYSGKMGNPKWAPMWDRTNTGTDTFGNPWSDFKIEVLDFALLTIDNHVYEERVTRHNTTIVKKADYNYKSRGNKRKRKDVPLRFVYEGVWAIGTPYMICWKKMDHQPRSRIKRQMAETRLPFHIYAPGLLDGSTKSIVERLRPLMDEYYVLTMKIQQEILESVPSGIAINLDAVVNIPMGKDGKETYEVLKLIDLYKAKGVAIYRGKDPAGDPIMSKPIDAISNGDLRKAVEFDNLRVGIIQRMKEISGITDAVAGTSIDPEQLVGTGKMMLQATHNSITSLWNGVKYLLESVNKNVLWRFQSIVRTDAEDAYERILGPHAINAISIGNEFQLYEIGIKIEEFPDEEKEFELKQDIRAAYQARQATGVGGITLADVFELERVKNIKQRQRLLTLRIKQNREKDMEMEKQRAQIQADANAQAAERAEAAKVEAAKQLTEIKIAEINAQKEADLEKLREEYRLRSTELEKKSELSITETALKADDREELTAQKTKDDLEKIEKQENLKGAWELKKAKEIGNKLSKGEPIN